jgi:hypothetical protein
VFSAAAILNCLAAATAAATATISGLLNLELFQLLAAFCLLNSLRLHCVPCGLLFSGHSVVIQWSFGGHLVVKLWKLAEAKAEERENSAYTFSIVSLFYC